MRTTHANKPGAVSEL